MDAVQLDMFAPVEEEPLHVICERKAEAICNELWAKYRGNVREYVAECVDRFVKAGIYWYDLRENACAITKIEEALLWLRKRTMGRENRGVEGTHTV